MMINSIVMTDHDDDNYNYVDYDIDICFFQDAAEKRNRRLSARRASFSGLEDVYKVDMILMKQQKCYKRETKKHGKSALAT